MRKKPSLFPRTIAAAGAVFVLDFLSKQAALSFAAFSSPGPEFFALRLMKSAGVTIGGTLIPNVALALLYIVIASVFASMAFASHLFLPPRLKAWPLGLGFAAGGFLANAIDRAMHGNLLDLLALNFTPLGWAWQTTFNIADLGELAGALLLLYGLLGAFSGEWTEERRGKLLVDRAYQFRFCLYLQGAMTIGFAPMFLAAVFLLGSSAAAVGTSGAAAVLPEGLQISFYLIAPLAYISLTLICWSIGISLSHRTAGAVIKFCRTAVVRLNRPVRRRDEENFSLRAGDDFRPRLEDVMKNIDNLRRLVEKIQRPKPAEPKR